ncbi:hypothetical protein [Taklimakanibacter albus]|uniref:Uncharacterized protein n=1 Tax=Taklimakanibacter albus TaxID=2800327 RepID=A0ACC5R7G0_9HYPH|nr:hypothetical protein [Aestuariivirga sp. YIM B02566]MBK1868431.1 hypothetical protein [Aestuariivirga sp. YIM B02566]
MGRLILGLLAVLLGWNTAAAELVKLKDFEVAGWDAAVYADAGTGKLANCMAWGSYKSNVNLHVIVYRDFRWGLGFSNDNWRMPTGVFRLAYRFDEGQWFTTNVWAHEEVGLSIGMWRTTQLMSGCSDAAGSWT